MNKLGIVVHRDTWDEAMDRDVVAGLAAAAGAGDLLEAGAVGAIGELAVAAGGAGDQAGVLCLSMFTTLVGDT